MADFKNHMLGAAIVSGLAATSLSLFEGTSNQAIVGYFALGVVGGLLPDIDSDSSIPVRVAFNVLSALCGFLIVFQFSAYMSLLELLILGVAIFCLIRFGIFSAFTKLTVHRGLFHSIPATVVATMLTAIIADYGFSASPLHAWTCGMFIGGGFLVHLILDEIYSVDLLGMQVKRSFGTAVSLGSLKDPLPTAALYVSIFALYLVVPPFDSFWAVISNGAVYEHLFARMIPSGIPFEALITRWL